MAEFWAVDRLEDLDWAILENDDGISVRVPRSWLPSAAQEGSVLRARAGDRDGLHEKDTSKELRFVVDKEETGRRRNQAEELRKNLRQGPEGDFDL